MFLKLFKIRNQVSKTVPKVCKCYFKHIYLNLKMNMVKNWHVQ